LAAADVLARVKETKHDNPDNDNNIDDGSVDGNNGRDDGEGGADAEDKLQEFDAEDNNPLMFESNL
jgi:hypothetical protein